MLVNYICMEETPHGVSFVLTTDLLLLESYRLCCVLMARVGELRKAVLSTRGPGRTNLWYVSCTARCMADWLRSGGITAEGI